MTVRDPATGDARGEVRLDDPFGGAAVMLWRHPDPACVVASIAAGQDGQAAYLIRDDGGVVTAREVPPRDRLPPVFTATGDAYLSGDADALEHRAWPSGDVLGEAAWSWDDDVEVDDPAGEDLQDLGGGFASWASEHGRLYAVDLARMERVDEIVIEGHPVVPLATRYPALAGDLTPCGDLRWSAPGPVGLIATVHGDATLAVSRVDDWRPPGASR